MTTKFSKYVVYAAIDFGDIAENALIMLEEVASGKVKVQFPLSVEYSGRKFKIHSSDELIVFHNAVQCTVDAMKQSRLELTNEYMVSLETDVTDSHRRTRNSFEPPYGVVNTDVFIL